MNEPAPAQAEEIVQAVQALLATAGDAREGGPRFELRVAARLMAVLQRELAQGREEHAAERVRLCEQIAAGQRGLGDAALMAQVWRSALAQLAIDNPDYRWREDGDAKTGS